MDTALGEGADTASLTPTAAQESVKTEGEGNEPDKGEEQTYG